MSRERRRRTKFVALNAFEAIKGIRNENFEPAVEFCERHDIPMEPVENYREGNFYFGWSWNTPENKKLDLIEKISDFVRHRINSETKTPAQVPRKGTGGS